MKKMILILIASFLQLFSQENKVIFYNTDTSVNTYLMSEIDSIKFNDLKNFTFVNIHSQGNLDAIELNKNSKIAIEDNFFTVFSNNKKQSFNMEIVDSVSFTSVARQSIDIKELVLDKVVLNANFPNPWSIAFLNNDEMLISENSGTIFKVNNKTETSKVIPGSPIVNASGQGGMLDIKLHPDFKNNKLVYLCYTVGANGAQVLAMGRGVLRNDSIVDYKELFKVDQPMSSANNQGSRMVFDHLNYLYLAVGDRFSPNFAQDTNSFLGKILRFNDDGTIPTDNPFYGLSNKKWAIWSLGHRNIQGMDINPNTRELWACEHGPKGGDELNLIKKGANYGWPKATFGVNYDGSIISKDTSLPGYEDPLMYWKPSIAPCGMTFVKYNYPTIEQDILMTALAGKQIVRIKIKDNKVVQNIINLNGAVRFRDVKQSPDGVIYAITESPAQVVKLKVK